MVVRDGFVVVRSGSWYFFSKILKKISCDPLFNQSVQDSVSNLILNETVVVRGGL